MAAKLTFNDIYNKELAGNKLSSVTFNTSLSVGVGTPNYTASISSLYIDSASGNLYRNTSGATTWIQLTSITQNIQTNKYPTLLTTVVSATDTTTPSPGDLIGIYGAGVWSLSGLLSASKTAMAGAGSQNAALVAGGTIGVVQNATELFNGATWSLSGLLSASKTSLVGAGSQNAGLVAGGTIVVSQNTTELFNGATWSLSGLLSASKTAMAGAGSQNAALVGGGAIAAAQNVTELFNGATWSLSGLLSASKTAMASAGSQNAGLVAGGFATAIQNVTELFNGVTWSLSSNLNASKSNLSACGSQNAGLVAGASNATELFNGSVWSLSGNLSASKNLAPSVGSQNAGLVTGGSTGVVQNTTELHAQTVYRKVYANQIQTAKSIGIFDGTGTNLLYKQGKTNIFYPVNSYLVSNRTMIASITNIADLSSIALASVLGTAPIMTYNFSGTANLLGVIPGMIAKVTGSGGTAANASNTGTFVVNKVISPTSIELINVNGITQNPATGTIGIISTLSARTSVSPQDIVIGKTDATGALILHKPIVVSSLNRRLK